MIGALSGLLHSAASDPPLQCGAILVATFILEDAATVLAATLAAQGMLSPELALPSLFAGIALGDAGLYALGRLAAQNRHARWLAGRDPARRARRWLDRELTGTVWMARFMPGMRVPAYSAFGFLGLPFRRFAWSVVAAVAVWTPLLFFAAYFLGEGLARVLGPWRWPVFGALALLVLLSGRLLRRLPVLQRWKDPR
jgi:membrane protein DedA with SNARE-associated domain